MTPTSTVFNILKMTDRIHSGQKAALISRGFILPKITTDTVHLVAGGLKKIKISSADPS